MAQPSSMLYALDPALPVLLRPDGAVQVGWSPHRAVLIRPPRGLTAAGLATLLRAMPWPVPPGSGRRGRHPSGSTALTAVEVEFVPLVTSDSAFSKLMPERASPLY